MTDYAKITATHGFKHANHPDLVPASEVAQRFDFTKDVRYEVSAEAADYFTRVGWAEPYEGDEPCHRVEGIIVDPGTVDEKGQKVFAEK